MCELMDTREAAAVLGVQPRTLEAWRLRGSGPRYVQVGRLVRYRRAAIEQWLAERERSSTSERPEPQAVA